MIHIWPLAYHRFFESDASYSINIATLDSQKYRYIVGQISVFVSDLKGYVGFASSFSGKCLSDPLLQLLVQLQLISGVVSASFNFHDRKAWDQKTKIP